MMSPSPPSVYAGFVSQLNAAKERSNRLEKKIETVSNLRLGVFFFFFAIGGFAVAQGWISSYWLVLGVFVFLGLVFFHENIFQKNLKNKLSQRFYQSALDRLTDKWIGKGVQIDFAAGKNHLYAADLDLFGKGSLFELLCTAKTLGGQEKLANWLCYPSPVEEIKKRHETILELKDQLKLREELNMLSEGVNQNIHPEILKKWGNSPVIFDKGKRFWIRIFAFFLSLTMLLLIAALLVQPTGSGFLALAVVVFLNIFFVSKLKKNVHQILAGIETPEKELKMMYQMLEKIEQTEFTSCLLKKIKTDLSTEGKPASVRIHQLDRIVQWLDAYRNMMFSPIGKLLNWKIQFAVSIEAWRIHYGSKIFPWIQAIGEFEALNALSGYAYEHPLDPFPRFTDEKGIEGVDLGHPLIPESNCVRNSVTLDESTPLWVVSGSNMCGKSTFLRAIGVNIVLAQAGAPVRAKQLSLSPFFLGAAIRVQDSLMEGYSKFYSEIKRIEKMLAIKEAKPGTSLFFLLDELLHGTNSHDRLIGAEGIIKHLLSSGAIGLITTHDLSLTKLADTLSPKAKNVHLEDKFEDGRLSFDYLLKPGVVERGNALQLMRSIGLKV